MPENKEEAPEQRTPGNPLESGTGLPEEQGDREVWRQSKWAELIETIDEMAGALVTARGYLLPATQGQVAWVDWLKQEGFHHPDSEIWQKFHEFQDKYTPKPR